MLVQAVPNRLLSPPPPSSPSNFDFDLDLLPSDLEVPSLDLLLLLPPTEDNSSSDNNNYSSQGFGSNSNNMSYCSSVSQQVPSPTNVLSPLEASMFSPMDHHQSSFKGDPDNKSLQESLAEFQELQDRIRQEQEQRLLTPPPPPPYAAPEEMLTVLLPPPPPYPKELMSIKEEEMEEEEEEEASSEMGSSSMDPVLSLAMEQVRKDIQHACQALQISPDPFAWSRSDVRSWLRWMMRQYDIDESSSPSPSHLAAVKQWSELGGIGFALLTEQEFRNKFQLDGELLYGQLDIWKSSAGLQKQQQELLTSSSTLSVQTVNPVVKKEETFDISYVLQMLEAKGNNNNNNNNIGSPTPSKPPPSTSSLLLTLQQRGILLTPPPPPPYPGSQQHEKQEEEDSVSEDDDKMEEEDHDDEDEKASSQKPSPLTSGGTTTTSSASSGVSTNIHLWQFVKELLNQPDHLNSGGCIHWVDRGRGIFKIVDSHRVASLWGKRKNRPAMNYDKLSRSLRQYYKKGIMKKTERTQRLVYQFCHPYHL